MNRLKFLVCLSSFFCITVFASAQNDRDLIRTGNRLYHSKSYSQAEVQYRKALAKNRHNTVAMYNLGNSLLMQKKLKDAMKMYEKVLPGEKNHVRLSKIYHNMGVILQSSKQYAEAIDCYKNSLRRNPHDNETRYNLALCQHLLKNQPPQNKNNKKKNNKNNKDNNNKDNKQKNNNNNNKDKQHNQNQNQSQNQNQNKMSKDNAEQLLNAVMQDEKNVQDRLHKVQRTSGKTLDKNW